MKNRTVVLFFLVTTSLSGCYVSDLTQAPSKSSLEKRISILEEKAALLDSKTRTLDTLAASLERQRFSGTARFLKQRSVLKSMEAILGELDYLSTLAFEYRTKPSSRGGGDGSFEGFKLPSEFANGTDYATYSVEHPKKDQILIVAISKFGWGTISLYADQTGWNSTPMWTGSFLNPWSL